ncbi:MAG: N-acetyltransferase [Nitrospiraceae bacterium]|nr:N-acetyltransferase [Nitrospiraceae bacterium]
MKIRRAAIADIKDIQKLVNEFARREEMIPRSINELYENVRDFFVAEEDGRICGACALHVLWEDLAEIRSLAVHEDTRGKGIGSRLVKYCMTDAKKLGIGRVFALTYRPGFFRRLGFTDIDKSSLPQKIWGDCIRCPKFPECDEHALILNLK